MDIILISLIILAIIVFIMVAINGFLFWYSYQANKKIDILLGKTLPAGKQGKILEDKIKEAFLKIKDLEDISKITIQKTGVVRYNPFSGMGGNQSFVIALLDAKNNGFVISSLFVKEGNRVYAKSIKNGKSEHLLSDEEKQAIENACLPAMQAIKS